MSAVLDISEFVTTIGATGAADAVSAPCACDDSVVGGAARGRARERPGAGALKALRGLTATTEECAEDVARAPGTACASRRVVQAVVAFADAVVATGEGEGASTAAIAPAAAPPTLPRSDDPASRAVRAAAEALECDSESCVITHPAFLRFVGEERLVDTATIERELATRFKAQGPRASTKLLNNYNIDETLRRWARLFPDFYPCPFAMMDFDRTQEPFAALDIVDVLEGRAPLDLGPGFGVVRRPARCFGCVVNTDTSTGPGKHWVAVFVDCRSAPWSVEYFNSAGNPPPRAMVGWMERTRARLIEHRRGGEVASVAVTDVDHQESQTECGLYALFYIRRRLEGTPYTFFVEQRVPDDAMTAFRAFVFRAV